MGRKLTDEQREMFEQFVMDFPFCWACGLDPTNYEDVQRERRVLDYPRWLERHHIIKCCRVHERWNICNLCKLCHDLAEMHTIRPDTEPLPYLKLEHVLYLKHLFDRDNYDPEAMQRYSLRKLPEPRFPPVWFMNNLVQRHRARFNIKQYGEKEA